MHCSACFHSHAANPARQTLGGRRSPAGLSCLSNRGLSSGHRSPIGLPLIAHRQRRHQLKQLGQPSLRRAAAEDRSPSNLSGSNSDRYADSDSDYEPSTGTAEGASFQRQQQHHDQEQLHHQQNSGNIVKLALQLPLELALTESRTDSHYLEKREKDRWWARDAFPRVPGDSLREVHKHPPPLRLWQKVSPLALIFFGASFNLTILQTLKDAIMVTTAGAETLPFLGSFCVLPASIAFFMIYGRMVESLPPRAVFYAAVTPLLAFYAVFATVLYPLSAVLHPLGLHQSLAALVPAGLHGLVKVVEYWTFSLFFCMAELWGSVVISVLFWSLANEVCSVGEARVVYPLMGIAANVALVVSGSLVKFVNTHLAPGNTLRSLRYLVGTVVVMSGVMMLAKAAVDRFIIGPESSSTTKPASKKKKKSGSFGESFAVLTSSPKIRNLALIVMGYGVSHRLFEFAWKGQLRILYPTSAAYQHMLADVSIATGYTTIILMLLGRLVFQYLGWGFAAAVTPGVMLCAGGAFFGMSLAANQGISVGGLNPAAMAISGAVAGAVTQVFARSSKFSLFDPAKEMVYIEMTKEEKSKGKAAVDLVGSQIGKSGAAWLTQALLLALGSITASLPIISCAFVGVITCWLGAVRSLDLQLKQYERQKQSAAAEAKVASAQEGGAAGSPIASGSASDSRYHSSHADSLTGTAYEATTAKQVWDADALDQEDTTGSGATSQPA